MKTDLSIIYMVPDHKQRVFQMRYRAGRVDYYGKKGIRLLGIIEIKWKVDGGVSGFEYSFVDFVEGYSSQYLVQVAAVIQLAVETV